MRCTWSLVISDNLSPLEPSASNCCPPLLRRVLLFSLASARARNGRERRKAPFGLSEGGLSSFPAKGSSSPFDAYVCARDAPAAECQRRNSKVSLTELLLMLPPPYCTQTSQRKVSSFWVVQCSSPLPGGTGVCVPPYPPLMSQSVLAMVMNQSMPPFSAIRPVSLSVLPANYSANRSDGHDVNRPAERSFVRARRRRKREKVNNGLRKATNTF